MVNKKRVASLLKYSIILLAVAYVLLQLFVLFVEAAHGDKTFYLGLTNLPVLLFNFSAAAAMIEFLWSSRSRQRKRLGRQTSLPLIVAASVLCFGVVVGNAYELLFTIAFKDCESSKNLWFLYFDGFVYVVRMIFAPLSLTFVLQRRFFKLPSDDQFERARAVLINVSLFVTTFRFWLDEGYSVLLYFCALQTEMNSPSVYCPVKINYTDVISVCDEPEALMKSEWLWYSFHTNFFQRAYLLCAAEFFPVIFILHWLSYGGKLKGLFNFTSNSGALLRDLTLTMVKSANEMSQGNDNWVSTAVRRPNEAAETPRTAAELRESNEQSSFAATIFIRFLFISLGLLHAVLMLSYLGSLYVWSVKIDESTTEDNVASMALGIAAFAVQVIFFGFLTAWAAPLCRHHFCAHRMKHMHGDQTLLVCAAFGTLVHLPLDSVNGQIVRTALQLTAHFFQLVVLCRCLALSDRALMRFRFFVPAVAITAAFSNFCAFCCMFMRLGIVHHLIHYKHYHMQDKPHATLFVLSQSFYPADFLFYFTATLCWTEILARYIKMGFFSVGQVNSSAEQNAHA
uniref:Uncharacterized protein n=1 Tax=Plectus sambesii TaxID=2011161 RepID=A0A914VZ92_9BILA